MIPSLWKLMSACMLACLFVVGTVFVVATGANRSDEGTNFHEKDSDFSQRLADGRAAPKAAETRTTRTGSYGDRLPDGAVARLGTARFRGDFHKSWFAYGQDGRSIMTLSDGGLRIWEAETGRERSRLPGFPASVSADRKTVVSFSPKRDGVIVRSASDGKQIAKFKYPKAWLEWAHVEISPNGKFIAIGQYYHSKQSPKLLVVRVSDGKEVYRQDVKDDPGNTAEFAPDGQRIAVSTKTEKGLGTQIINFRTGKIEHFFPSKGNLPFQYLRYSPRGDLLITGIVHFHRFGFPSGLSAATTTVLDVKTGRKLWKFSSVGIAFSPDNETVATLESNMGLIRGNVISNRRTNEIGVIHLRDSRTGNIRKTISPGLNQRDALKAGDYLDTRAAVTFSPDGKTIATCDHVIRRWDVKTGREIFTTPKTDPTGAIHGGAYLGAFSRDGKRFYSWTKDRVIRIWNSKTGEMIDKRQFSGTLFEPAALSLHGERYAQLGQDGHLEVWETPSGKRIARWKSPQSRLASLTFGPGGKILAAANSIGRTTIWLWDVETEKLVRKFQPTGKFDGVRQIRLSEDGKILGIVSDRRRNVAFWEVSTGNGLKMPEEFRDFVFSPDNKHMAVWIGPADKLQLWIADRKTGRLVRPMNIGQCDGFPWAEVQFSPDGRLVAFGDGEALRFFEVQTGKLRRTLRGHDSTLRWVRFSSDGRLCATSRFDTTMLVWDFVSK
ncbi:MAG: WD40 repeat domain-containing protein [Gemmataceae bacterium]